MKKDSYNALKLAGWLLIILSAYIILNGLLVVLITTVPDIDTYMESEMLRLSWFLIICGIWGVIGGKVLFEKYSFELETSKNILMNIANAYGIYAFKQAIELYNMGKEQEEYNLEEL